MFITEKEKLEKSFINLQLSGHSPDEAARLLNVERVLPTTAVVEEVETTNLEQVQKLSESIKSLLVLQISHELRASQQYRQNACWMDANSFEGGQKLFMTWAKEELEHMNSIYEYLFNQNSVFNVPSTNIEIVNNFSSIKEVLEYTLNLEMSNTEQWRNIALQAKDQSDFQTYTLAEGYLKEQIEEEDKVRKLLFKINLNIPNWELDELMSE